MLPNLRVLEAGKYVLCEKSFTLNAAEARQVDVVIKRLGRTVMEAFMYRFHPQIEQALEILRRGVSVNCA